MPPRAVLLVGLLVLMAMSGCPGKSGHPPGTTTPGSGGGGSPYAENGGHAAAPDESLIYEPPLGAARLSADVA